MNEYRQITEAFQENFRNYGELGASVSVWKEGREIVSLHSGFAAADKTRPWTEHSLVPVYSATKGAASAALLLALGRAALAASAAAALLAATGRVPLFPGGLAGDDCSDLLEKTECHD